MFWLKGSNLSWQCQPQPCLTWGVWTCMPKCGCCGALDRTRRGCSCSGGKSHTCLKLSTTHPAKESLQWCQRSEPQALIKRRKRGLRETFVNKVLGLPHSSGKIVVLNYDVSAGGLPQCHCSGKIVVYDVWWSQWMLVDSKAVSHSRLLFQISLVFTTILTGVCCLQASLELTHFKLLWSSETLYDLLFLEVSLCTVLLLSSSHRRKYA